MWESRFAISNYTFSSAYFTQQNDFYEELNIYSIFVSAIALNFGEFVACIKDMLRYF